MHRYSQTCFAVAFVLFALAFGILGCTKFYKAVGVPDKTIEVWQADDELQAIEHIGEARTIFWECVSAGVALLGGAVSGYLGLKLRESNKINTATISGVEKVGDGKVKAAIESEASHLGVSEVLYAKVKALT